MLAAAGNVLCFPEALTDDVTNAGHGWAGMQSLWLTDWFSWANPPKQHMLQTTDSCFPKEVSLCCLLLPETRSQRFQKSAKLRNSGYREPGRRWLHFATLNWIIPPLSLSSAFLILCPYLFHLEIWKEFSCTQTVVSPLLRIWNPEQVATFVVQSFVNVAADQKISNWWSLA